MSVRKSPPPTTTTTTTGGGGGALTKRARVDDDGDDGDDGHGTTMTVASSGAAGGKGALVRSVKRTSGLAAPIVSLGGAHRGEIIACKFDKSGERIAAASADRCVSLWQTYPPHENNGYLPNLHKQAITDLAFSPTDPSLIYTVSADGTLLLTSLTSGQKVGKFSAHYGPVNSLSVTSSTATGTDLILTGGDDGVARVWDPVRLVEDGEKSPVAELDDGLGGCVTAVEWGKDGAVCFVGGIDNEIKVWDLRKQEILYTLKGHTDTIASLALSPSGHHLLSYSLDSTLMIHDVRPFSSDPTRVYRTLTGAPAGFEQMLIKCQWSRTDGGARVACGGGDRTVTVWEVESGKILYKLGGHKGSVGAVDWHPREPIILTGGKDGQMLLGEIDAEDRS